MTLPGQPTGVSQTSFIFAIVFVAYLIFITLRGDLAKWLGVFGFGTYTAPASTTATTGVPGNITSQTGSATGTNMFGGGNANITSQTNPNFGSLNPVNTGYTGPTYIDTTSGF